MAPNRTAFGLIDAAGLGVMLLRGKSNYAVGADALAKSLSTSKGSILFNKSSISP